jgi:hypothetical protein
LLPAYSPPTDKFWEEESKLLRMIETIETILHITDKKEWYRVSVVQLAELGCLHGASGQVVLTKVPAIKQKGGLLNVLKLVYPHHDWSTLLANNTKKSGTKNSPS